MSALKKEGANSQVFDDIWHLITSAIQEIIETGATATENFSYCDIISFPRVCKRGVFNQNSSKPERWRSSGTFPKHWQWQEVLIFLLLFILKLPCKPTTCLSRNLLPNKEQATFEDIFLQANSLIFLNSCNLSKVAEPS